MCGNIKSTKIHITNRSQLMPLQLYVRVNNY